MRRRWSAVCFFLFNLLTLSSAAEEFHEELTIHPLPDGKISSRFAFTTLLKDISPRKSYNHTLRSQHYTVFPLALGQILQEYTVTEFHLTLNAGNWNYERWGSPKESGVATGAELWAWLEDGAATTVDHRWNGLRNALAGLFCASLGSLDKQRTTSPTRSFDPIGTLPQSELPYQIRHASLPSEHVCTENLTPFLKLLPCKSSSGIASLLNSHRIFDADWHGMGVHVVWRRDEGVEVRLTFESVFDPLRIVSNTKQDWSFRSIFDRTINRACPIAKSSRVIVALPNNVMYSISPEPSSTEENLAIFDVSRVGYPLDISMQWAVDFMYTLNNGSVDMPVSIQRTLRGTSQARGELSLVIKNHQTSSLRVLYLETLPWLVQLYLHTMQIHIDGHRRDDIMSNVSYSPAVAHSRPTTFQCFLTLPAQSTSHLTMDLTKSFLRYTEHPPDAQRGWDLPPAVFTLLNSDADFTGESSPDLRVYTSTLLLDLATPDFSMPYNVIIFTCSLIAFIFGSIFNLLTRKFVAVRMDS